MAEYSRCTLHEHLACAAVAEKTARICFVQRNVCVVRVPSSVIDTALPGGDCSVRREYPVQPSLPQPSPRAEATPVPEVTASSDRGAAGCDEQQHGNGRTPVSARQKLQIPLPSLNCGGGGSRRCGRGEDNSRDTCAVQCAVDTGRAGRSN